MQTMFHYSIKEHVLKFYGQEKKKVSYPVDFGVFYITRHIFFFVYIAKLLIHPMHWDVSENLK